jgi:hypothetical protein
VKTAFSDELVIEKHLEPIYPGLGELTIPYLQPNGYKPQRTLQLNSVNWCIGDLFLGSFVYAHDMAGGSPLVTGYLEVDIKLRMDIGERPSTGAGPDTTQVTYAFLIRVFLDLVTQDHDVYAGKDRSVCHGLAPPGSRG